MIEVRLARKDEKNRQKEIWKACFGDPDRFIDFFYINRYKEENTVVLIYDGVIAAMLTLIPIQLIVSGKGSQRSLNSSMLYAIATHPEYQKKGLATQLMDYAHRYLQENGIKVSVLVPAEESLFEFYRRQGYREGFAIREGVLTREQIMNLPGSASYTCRITAASVNEYNRRRNTLLSDRNLLKGSFYIAYADEEIEYQKKLSQLSGVDIYLIDTERVQGCAVIERVNPEKVMIKELLTSEEALGPVLRQITQNFLAQEYTVRTPASLGESLGGMIRPFGMIRPNQETHKDFNREIEQNKLGYLGLAFD